MAVDEREPGSPGAEGKPGEDAPPGRGGRGGKGGGGGAGGKRGPRGRRGPRDSRRLMVILCVLAGLFLLVTAVSATVNLVQQGDIEDNAASIADLDAEAATREDQTCILFEKGHLADVEQLRDTYAYLLALTPEEKLDALNRFVLAALPKTEQEARIDSAPRYCDKPHRGLPEPDPVVPKRPPGLVVPEPPPDGNDGTAAPSDEAPGLESVHASPQPGAAGAGPGSVALPGRDDGLPFREPRGSPPSQQPPAAAPEPPAAPLPEVLCRLTGLICVPS